MQELASLNFYLCLFCVPGVNRSALGLCVPRQTGQGQRPQRSAEISVQLGRACSRWASSRPRDPSASVRDSVLVACSLRGDVLARWRSFLRHGIAQSYSTRADVMWWQCHVCFVVIIGWVTETERTRSNLCGTAVPGCEIPQYLVGVRCKEIKIIKEWRYEIGPFWPKHHRKGKWDREMRLRVMTALPFRMIVWAAAGKASQMKAWHVSAEDVWKAPGSVAVL